MTDLINNLALGFSVVLTPINLAYCFIGVTAGTFVGVLPGFGPLAGVALLLPVTFYLPPESALLMLAGVYYGAQYGGSTASVLVNIPGDAGSVVTCLDGHAMARQGNAGVALGVAAIGSFFAGTVATFLIALFGPPLVKVALSFGPAEYFALMVLGLVTASVLAHGPLLNALVMVFVGVALGLVGTDTNSGILRYTFGIPELFDGINLVAMAIGLFGFSRIIVNLEHRDQHTVIAGKVRGVWPGRRDFRKSWKPVIRGAGLGSLLGVLPGGGATLGSFSSYVLEKRLAADRSRFGKGAIEGVAGPESANNAAAQTSFIPLLTLGIPPNPTIALMGGALMIQGITPGPGVMTNEPELFWGIIASMWIGNLMLVILNLPLIGLWVRLLSIPYRLLYPAVLLFSCIGVYSFSSSATDIVIAALFGLFGYILIKLDCEPAPLTLGFILGPLMEQNLRRALLIAHGDATVFLTRPLSLALLLAAALLLLAIVVPAVRQTRQRAFQG